MADTELEEIRQLCIEKIYCCTDNVLKYLEDDKEKELDKLTSYVKHHCLHDAYPDVIEQVSEKIQNEFHTSNVDKIEDRFNIYFQKMIKEKDVTNHPWMVELDKMIKRCNGIPENLDESDLAITGAAEVFVDPLTKRPFQDPVRNKICGHTYERSSIQNHMKLRKEKAFCPLVGCHIKQPVLEEHLVIDYDARCRISQKSTMNRKTVHEIDVDSE